MKYLLDTHTILWFLNGERLTDNAKEMIQSYPSYISVISLWEVAIKMNIGKYSATSLAEGMTVITADENIQKYDILWAW